MTTSYFVQILQNVTRYFNGLGFDSQGIGCLCLCYSKCSKITNIFLALFVNKILVSRAGVHKMLVRIENRVDPDQTAFDASSEAV